MKSIVDGTWRSSYDGDGCRCLCLPIVFSSATGSGHINSIQMHMAPWMSECVSMTGSGNHVEWTRTSDCVQESHWNPVYNYRYHGSSEPAFAFDSALDYIFLVVYIAVCKRPRFFPNPLCLFRVRNTQRLQSPHDLARSSRCHGVRCPLRPQALFHQCRRHRGRCGHIRQPAHSAAAGAD